jgi:hypothetical protein
MQSRFLVGTLGRLVGGKRRGREVNTATVAAVDYERFGFHAVSNVLAVATSFQWEGGILSHGAKIFGLTEIVA